MRKFDRIYERFEQDIILESLLEEGMLDTFKKKFNDILQDSTIQGLLKKLSDINTPTKIKKKKRYIIINKDKSKNNVVKRDREEYDNDMTMMLDKDDIKNKSKYYKNLNLLPKDILDQRQNTADKAKVTSLSKEKREELYRNIRKALLNKMDPKDVNYFMYSITSGNPIKLVYGHPKKKSNIK